MNPKIHEEKKWDTNLRRDILWSLFVVATYLFQDFSLFFQNEIHFQEGFSFCGEKGIMKLGLERKKKLRFILGRLWVWKFLLNFYPFYWVAGNLRVVSGLWREIGRENEAIKFKSWIFLWLFLQLSSFEAGMDTIYEGFSSRMNKVTVHDVLY